MTGHCRLPIADCRFGFLPARMVRRPGRLKRRNAFLRGLDRLAELAHYAAGDLMLDASANAILDASGNLLLDDGAGCSSCCGGGAGPTGCPCGFPDGFDQAYFNGATMKVTIAGWSYNGTLGECNAANAIVNSLSLNGTYCLTYSAAKSSPGICAFVGSVPCDVTIYGLGQCTGDGTHAASVNLVGSFISQSGTTGAWGLTAGLNWSNPDGVDLVAVYGNPAIACGGSDTEPDTGSNAFTAGDVTHGTVTAADIRC